MFVGHQNVGQPIAGQVDQAQVRVGQVEDRHLVDVPEIFPGSLRRCLVEALLLAVKYKQVGPAVAAHIGKADAWLGESDSGRRTVHRVPAV